MTKKVLLSLLVGLFSFHLYADNLYPLYAKAGKSCETDKQSIERLFSDYQRWLTKPDSVKDMRLRLKENFDHGCKDGLLNLLYAKSMLYAGKAFLYPKRCQGAITILKSSLPSLKSQYPTNYLKDAYLHLGHCYNGELKDSKTAVNFYQLALKAEPRSNNTLQILATVQLNRGELKDARKYAQALLESKTTTQREKGNALWVLGKIALQESDPNQAINYLKQADKNLPNAYNTNLKSEPMVIADLALAYDQVDKKLASEYWEWLVNFRRKKYFPPNLQFSEDVEKQLQSLAGIGLLKKTQTKNKFANPFGWDLSYTSVFEQQNIDLYDNFLTKLQKQFPLNFDDIDKNNIKSAVLIDTVAFHYFGYRFSRLYIETKQGETLGKTYEEKNTRRKEGPTDKSRYQRLLRLLQAVKPQKPQSGFDTFSGYNIAISLYDQGKMRQYLLDSSKLDEFLGVELILDLVKVQTRKLTFENKEKEKTSAPLIYAIKRFDWQAARKLIKTGTALDIADEKDKRTPLHLLLLEQNRAEIETLLDSLLSYGLVCNQQDSYGITPLMIATSSKLETLQAVLACSGDINQQNNEGETALHYAALVNNHEITQLLIKNGADKFIKDNQNKTPLDHAKEANNQSVIPLLE